MLRLALVGAIFAALLSVHTVEAGPKKLKDFGEVFVVANQLESAQMLILGNDMSEKLREKRNDLLKEFMRESKVAHCSKHAEQLRDVVNDYRQKAYEYINDNNKSKNWFSSIASKIAGPMNSMKGLSKFSRRLHEMTERYESQSKIKGLLKQVDVDCDLYKLQIATLDQMLFVLKADLKFLVSEEPHLLNKAIYERLKQDKFESSNNFYETRELTQTQRDLLAQFYNSQVDSNSKTIGEASDHIESPGANVIGRLLEDCNILPEYVKSWEIAEAGRAKVCPASISDPLNVRFPSDFKVAKYAELATFCSHFFNSL